jgi:hypothetical protein
VERKAPFPEARERDSPTEAQRPKEKGVEHKVGVNTPDLSALNLMGKAMDRVSGQRKVRAARQTTNA